MANDRHNAKRQRLLSSMLNSDEYSDLTITCQGQIFKAHKVIVCSQSAFFEKACKKNAFKEGETGLIDLPDDDPTAVKAMIELMYSAGDTTPSGVQPLIAHAKVACLAHKYQFIGSTKPVHENLRSITLGTKKGPCLDDMIEAIRYIYDNTDETSDAREAIVESAAKNICILLKQRKEKMAKMIAVLSEFGRDMTMRFAVNEANRAKTTLEENKMCLCHCATCNTYWKINDENTDASCPACEDELEWVVDPRNKWKCEDCGEVIMSNVGGFGRRKWTCNICDEKGFEAVEA